MPPEAEWRPLLERNQSSAPHERLRSMRQRCTPSMDYQQLPIDFQLRYLHLDELAALQLLAHCQSWDESHPVAHGYESLDGLKARQLHLDVQRRLMRFELSNYSSTKRRDNIMRDKAFRTQIFQRNFTVSCKGVQGADNEHHRVCVNANCF